MSKAIKNAGNNESVVESIGGKGLGANILETHPAYWEAFIDGNKNNISSVGGSDGMLYDARTKATTYNSVMTTSGLSNEEINKLKLNAIKTIMNDYKNLQHTLTSQSGQTVKDIYEEALTREAGVPSQTLWDVVGEARTEASAARHVAKCKRLSPEFQNIPANTSLLEVGGGIMTDEEKGVLFSVVDDMIKASRLEENAKNLSGYLDAQIALSETFAEGTGAVVPKVWKNSSGTKATAEGGFRKEEEPARKQ